LRGGAAGVAGLAALSRAAADRLLPPDWDPREAGQRVLAGLVRVTAPEVKGAHDAAMALVGDHAYIVAEVSELGAGESADRPEIYSSMSIVRLDSLELGTILPVARSNQAFENTSLPEGACFVPRILRINNRTLRCYFASEQPGERQSQTWRRDFDLDSGEFAPTIRRAMLRTSAGVFDMQPEAFHADAVRHGFTGPAADYGLYVFDSFKRIDGRLYTTLNNYPAKQNALARLRDDFATFEIVGHYNEPHSAQLSESAANRLPDGTWAALCRQDRGDRNYLLTTSRDGVRWTTAREAPFVQNGWNSKPTFDRFGEVYYLGWQDADRVDGVTRSIFNVDVSRDGRHWERKYRFETARSFQYPTFAAHRGAIWVCATQGHSSKSRKEEIVFGKLESRAS